MCWHWLAIIAEARHAGAIYAPLFRQTGRADFAGRAGDSLSKSLRRDFYSPGEDIVAEGRRRALRADNYAAATRVEIPDERFFSLPFRRAYRHA